MTNRNIQILTPEAQGVTTNLMCMMMEGDPYGTLMIDGVRYDVSILSKMLKLPENKLMSILDEIVQIGKDIKIDTNGLVYSEHMIKDAEISEKRKAIGAMGGNPALTGKLPVETKWVPPSASQIDSDKYITGTDPITPDAPVVTTEKNSPEEEVYVTKKGRKLYSKQLTAFNTFWKEFDYKAGRSEAADAWFDLKVDFDLFDKIIKGARREATKRPGLIEKGSTPKMAQGWLSSRRWEDGQ